MKIEGIQTCPNCRHPGNHHFTAEDEIGYWAFCILQECDCFIDERIEDEAGH